MVTNRLDLPPLPRHRKGTLSGNALGGSRGWMTISGGERGSPALQEALPRKSNGGSKDQLGERQGLGLCPVIRLYRHGVNRTWSDLVIAMVVMYQNRV